MISRPVGSEFFERAALALTIGLDTRWAGIVRRSRDGETGEFLACIGDGHAMPGRTYPLSASPCAAGYMRGAAERNCLISEGLGDRYPTNEMGESTGAVAYHGEVFVNSEGRAAGHVFVMDDRPIRRDPECRWFLHLVGRLVGAEYGRWQAEQEAEGLRVQLSQAGCFRDLVANCPLGFFVHRGGELLFVNDAAARMFGCESGREVMQAPSMSDFMAPAERERLMAFCEACMSGHEVPSRYEAQYKRKDGTEITVEVMASLIDWDGAPAVQITLFDMTQRHERERRLHGARRMEALEQLTGGVAHDFNNILSIILGNLDLARELVSQPLVADHIDRSMDAAARGASLTHHLLSFARRQPLHPEAISPEALEERIRKALMSVAGRGEIETEITLAIDLWNSLADPKGLRNALASLMANAVDALSTGGKLSIGAANVSVQAGVESAELGLVPGDYVRITVSDDGIGMSPEVARRAFEPFFSTKTVGKGSGLGLSVVYGFARQLGGTATVESTEGSGSVATLFLPRHLPGETEPAAAGTEPTQGHGEVVLVVEDDPDVRKLVVLFLEGFGYEVREAADASQAESILASALRIDLLLTDLQLPGEIGGVELMARCVARQPGLPVIFMSGHAGVRSEDLGFLDKEVRVLAKPFRRAEIATAVRTALDEAGS